MNVCRENFIFQGETLNCKNWKGKGNNRVTSDSKPSTFKTYNAYITASTKKMS